MTRIRNLYAATTILAATLALPAAGWAQTTEGPTAPVPAQSMPGQTPSGGPPIPAPSTSATAQPGAPAAGANDQSARLEQGVERHIAMLRKQLGITQAEEPQWNQFAQVMRDNAQAMSQSLEQRAQQVGTMNAPQSMLTYAQLAEQRSQDLMKLSTAFQTLYNSFSDQQKKTADTLFQRQAEARADHHEAKHADKHAG